LTRLSVTAAATAPPAETIKSWRDGDNLRSIVPRTVVASRALYYNVCHTEPPRFCVFGNDVDFDIHKGGLGRHDWGSNAPAA
jgi:hypothetical protein